MATFDQLVPTNISDVLGMTQAPRAPVPMSQGGMAEAIGVPLAPTPQVPPEAAATSGGGPGDWLRANPKIAGALLHGLLSLSTNGQGSRASQIGQALQTGVTYSMAQDLANQNKAEKDAAVKREEEKTKALNDREQKRIDLEGQRVALEGRRTTAAEKQTDASVAATEATTAATRQSTQQAGDLFPEKRQQLQLQIDKTRQDLSNAKTEQERQRAETELVRLRKQSMQLELDNDRQFSQKERQARLGTAEAGVTAQTIANQAAGTKADALQTLSPEEIATGSAKPRAYEDRLQQYVKDRIANSITPVTIDQAIAEFERLDQHITAKKATVRGGQPAAGEASPKGPVDMAAWEAAKNSVPVGGTYRGPDGNFYKRSK